MIVVATDAPLDARNLKRLVWTCAHRQFRLQRQRRLCHRILGRARIAHRIDEKALTRNATSLTNDAMSPLFEAAIEAIEEAAHNSIF